MHESGEIKPRSKRGGRRPGAGRPKGARTKATMLEKHRLTELAKGLMPEAFEALARILRNEDTPPSAIVAAVNLLADRAYGKPMQAIEHTGKDGGPIAYALTDEGRSLLDEVMPRIDAALTNGRANGTTH